MKWFLILWAGPIALLGSWYGLSYYDMNFGIFMLTRDAHDLARRNVEELGGAVDEAQHQPRAGDAVDLRPRARHSARWFVAVIDRALA